jgi:hypothetical protein
VPVAHRNVAIGMAVCGRHRLYLNRHFRVRVGEGTVAVREKVKDCIT